MIKAVIFDMDGLIIDSEPFWRKAHVRVLARHGFTITEDDVRAMAGITTIKIVGLWRERFGWNESKDELIKDEIINDVAIQVQESGKALPGVYDLVKDLASRSIPLAVASSSPIFLIEAVLEKLELRDYFQIIHSATLEKRSKPFPDVFLATAKQLGVLPADCLVFEDAASGVQAAKAAGMKCIAVPEIPYDSAKFADANLIVDSLTKVNMDLINSL